LGFLGGDTFCGDTETLQDLFGRLLIGFLHRAFSFDYSVHWYMIF
jgi:hypothetical protein